ncbi:flavin-containing monooxygenase [Rhizobium rhizogenes]|uniref:flavin-containing monooxygenase n=1 Tax=Rhizobium rhizogenes TaxID=359 RepID=UPI00157370C9|nr:NAD(P)/FAD-dependent oxidoreductase [Rhizobium rhizogenes]NTH22903.1 NAD(P)-binding domain-containing protein [Rhizobium rhizogenes]NTH35932.1 NAD(P)-binding domain-containing protein [Rhizobium rhizogenes]
MSLTKINTVVVGGGQAGLAVSEHLSKQGVNHVVLERGRIAERWRSERWNSFTANGPAWHDRVPTLEFRGLDPETFANKEQIVEYFNAYANQIDAPVRTGAEVSLVQMLRDEPGFSVKSSTGNFEAMNVVAATGPFQVPIIPSVVPPESEIVQLHSNQYFAPQQLPEGGVLVVGAGSSGAQIADELLRSGRPVHLAIGRHQRPPRRYRGKDFAWWLDVLGHWEATTRDPAVEHVTIAVSGAHGGSTVDFREFASRGMKLVGRAASFENGTMHFRPDLADNLAKGDSYHMSVLDEADAYAAREGLALPLDPYARFSRPDPDCVANPILSLDLRGAGITSIIWATGYALDFSWLDLPAFDDRGRPVHQRGVSAVRGLYFLGLPWLHSRQSPFIFGVWNDAKYIAAHLASRLP